MSMREIMLALKVYYSNAEDVEKIIIGCALTAATADVVGALIPGVAVIATITSCFGAVWVMYAKICKALGIKFSEDFLKVIARAVISNLAANAAALVGGGIVAMFIPGASVAASATLVFVCVYLAGMMFAKLLVGLAQQKNGKVVTLDGISEDVCADIIKEQTSDVINVQNIKDAREIHKKNK